MKLSDCTPQKMSKALMAFILLCASIGLVIIGMTILPYIGFILAIPVFALSVYVFRLHLNKECEIDFPS